MHIFSVLLGNESYHLHLWEIEIQNAVGGRLHGGLACLLRCEYEHETVGEEFQQCENRCNSIFMTLKPIEFEGDVVQNYY